MANQSVWGAFVRWMFSSKTIEIPGDFQGRCADIKEMLDNDVSGIVSTLLDYMVNSAAEAKFKVECSNETLENLLDIWLQQINIYVDLIPTGLQELAREYYRERWKGSSLCLMKVSDWKSIKSENNIIEVPTTLWFFNGASVWIDRPNANKFKLGTDKYFSDSNLKNAIVKSDKESFVIQKPGSRWTDQYPSPYCVRKGILKNYKAIEVLQSKGDEVITKVLPYILQQVKGTEAAFIQKGLKFSPDELKSFQNVVKTALKRYKNEKGEVPLATTPFDEEFKHIVADILPMVREELFRQGTRNLLAGLGFIDLLEISPSRQETRLNPKPFILEVNDGVDGFKSILKEVIYLIINRNKDYHKKFFSDNTTLKIVNTPIRINVEQILDQLRSGFVYGGLTIETYHEVLGIDHDQEIERMRKEWDDGLRELFYPHVIQNTEEKGIDTNISAPPITKKQLEKQKEKEKAFENLIAKCKKCGHEFDYLSIPEAGMGYVKCPKCEESVTQEDLIMAPYQSVEELIKKHPYMKKYPKGALEVFIKEFNESLPKGEDYAFPVAYTAMKRWLKKHGYKKVGDKWIKSEIENENN
jgi:predicted Zn-ribbon and HTH transcriptional regulator